MNFLDTYKPLVDGRLKQVLAEKRDSLALVNAWGPVTIDRLLPFVTRGKTIRGSLVVYSYCLFLKNIPTHVLDVAAAVELFQSGFLIHDDIMDQDSLRRGQPSFYKQYKHIAVDRGGTDFERFGESMAINAGDLCFFMAYELMGQIPGESNTVLRLVSRQYQDVVAAQMQDVSVSHIPTSLTKDDVLSLYLHKTARYSFSLPLKIGALLAHAGKQAVDELDTLGECLGILFQMRDDELSVKGDSTVTGKPTGSDQKNRKQTLKSILPEEAYNALRIEQYAKAQAIIELLPIAATAKDQFVALAKFCQNRKK